MNPIFLIFLVFVMIQCFFFIFSLIAEVIYDFFLRWWILFFHSLIKSTLLAGKENCFLIYLFFFTKANNKKNRVMSSEFGKLILYIWKSFPSKISAARANFLRLFGSSKRFWFSFFTFKHGVIQTSVEYLNQFLIDTRFTSVARRYQLVNSVHFFK